MSRVHNVVLIQQIKDIPTRRWYALQDVHKPIGIAEYKLTRALPQELASSLPSIEAIEAELTRDLGQDQAESNANAPRNGND